MAVEAAASVMAGSVLAAALDLESGESFTSTTDIQLEMPNFRRSHRASAPAAEGGSNAEALGSAANLEPHSPMRPRPRLALSPSRLSRETSTSSPRDVGNPPNTSRNRRNSHVESSSAQANASDEGRRTGGRRSWTRGSVVSAPPPGVSLDLGTKRKKRVSFSIALQLTLFVAVLVVVSSGSMALVLW